MLLTEDFNPEHSFKRYTQTENTINNKRNCTRHMKGDQDLFNVCMSMEEMQCRHEINESYHIELKTQWALVMNALTGDHKIYGILSSHQILSKRSTQKYTLNDTPLS